MKKKYGRIAALMLTAVISAALVSGYAPIPTGGAQIETVVISEGNTAPVAENIRLETFMGVAVSGNMSAIDPEGESMTFEITSQPKKGAVSVGENGAFTYTPEAGKKGKDSFTYTAADRSGNVSGGAEVAIEILKQKTAVSYADMEGSDAHYAALVLSEKGIITGECIAGSYFFRPDENVTAVEFLAMCVKASGKEVIDGVVRTGLDNDGEIPMWAKGYISTAVLTGSYTGGDTFDYGGDITCEQAAVMLDASFSFTDAVMASALSPYMRTASGQAVMNLIACDIADASIISDYDKPLTRADAAMLLCRAMAVAENR